MSDFITRLAEQIRIEVPPSVRPNHPAELRLFRMYALLALSKGSSTTREDVHNAWAAWMLEIDPTHSAIRPFRELTDEQHQQDDPFLRAINHVSEGPSS